MELSISPGTILGVGLMHRTKAQSVACGGQTVSYFFVTLTRIYGTFSDISPIYKHDGSFTRVLEHL